MKIVIPGGSGRVGSVLASALRDDDHEVVGVHLALSQSAATLRAGADRYRRWIAVERGRIVGFCEHDLDGVLSRLYVHKDHLRKGIGSRLLAAAEASLTALGFTQATLESTVTAQDFYAANGYTLVERAANRGDTTEPVFKMRKRL